MSDNASLDAEREPENGQINYASEVIATIVCVATTEVEGISGISGSGASLSSMLTKGRIPRGVKVDMSGNQICADISVTVEYGMPIQKVGRNVQENVRKSIESMTGLHVEKVDLHVVGVSFEKENQEMQQSQKLAMDLDSDAEQTPSEKNAHVDIRNPIYGEDEEDESKRLVAEIFADETAAESEYEPEDDMQEEPHQDEDVYGEEPLDDRTNKEEYP